MGLVHAYTLDGYPRQPTQLCITLPLPACHYHPCLPALQAQELRDFLLPMLDFDPARRATAAEMLAHPWLQQDLPPQQRAAPASQRQRGAGRHRLHLAEGGLAREIFHAAVGGDDDRGVSIRRRV